MSSSWLLNSFDELDSLDFISVLEPYKDWISQISSLLKLLIDSLLQGNNKGFSVPNMNLLSKVINMGFWTENHGDLNFALSLILDLLCQASFRSSCGEIGKDNNLVQSSLMMDFKPGFFSIAGRCFGVNTSCAISVMSQVCRLWVLIVFFIS
jgi:hypothetical protein